MSSKIDRAIEGQLLFPKGFGQPQKTRKLIDYKGGESRPVCGFDIEADAITGEPFLLGYSTDDNEYNYHLLKDRKAMFDIHTRFSFRQSINFYYNLQYDFEGMLKLYDKDVAVLLYGSGTSYLDEELKALSLDMMKEELKKWSYRLSYLPKKAFHIKIAGDKKYSFFDLLQFYQMGLNAAAKSYLTDEEKDDFKAEFTSKRLFELDVEPEQEMERFEDYIRNKSFLTEDQKEKKVIEMRKFFGRFPSSLHYRQLMIRYCMKDASICRKLGHIIVEGVNGFVNTKNFNSSASISEYYFRSNGIGVPKFAPSVFKEFMKPYYGGRFESMKKGFIKGVSIYDIKSAYPDAMKDMMILSKSPTVKNSYSLHEEALYGTYKISVEIPPDEYLSPLQVRDGLLWFPTGKFNEYYVDKVTLTNLLNRNYDVVLHSAFEIFDDQAQPQLYDLILKLFNIKEDKKGQPEVVRLAAKIILNSLYGKFIQLVDDTGLELVKDMEELDAISPAELFHIVNRYYKKVHTMNFNTGKLFAPQYASFITSHARNKLYNTAMSVGAKKMIGFHTDSIMLVGNDLINTGHKIGDWELEELKDKETGKKVACKDANLWFLKTGFYQVERDGIMKKRARGVGGASNLLQESFIVKRRLGLRQAIKKNFEEMNIISEMPIDNDVNGDSKRVWFDDLTMQELIDGKMIDSRPRVLGEELEDEYALLATL